MNKTDLAGRVAKACKISQAQSSAAIDSMTENITAALRKGEHVALIGFGSFTVSHRSARRGRNPQTGKPLQIKARKVARFTPGAMLKKAVNRSG